MWGICYKEYNYFIENYKREFLASSSSFSDNQVKFSNFIFHSTLTSVDCFGFQYNLSKYISNALISHFLAFARRVITSSRSTSSIDWSVAILAMASRKRVSTLLDQGVLQGHHGFQGLNCVSSFGISEYYPIKYGCQFLLISSVESSFIIRLIIVWTYFGSSSDI